MSIEKPSIEASPRNPWFWIPTLNFSSGLPYVVVMMLATVMYKDMGVSNTDIALYTSWLYLPWVIKPLWSPMVDMLRTKRFWIVTMQLIIGASLGLVALTLKGPDYFVISLTVLWLMAFSSATHDIAADGFYMLGLRQDQQAAFVGVRSAFYRLAMIAGQGALIWLAGQLMEDFVVANTGLADVKLQSAFYAWQIVFGVLGTMFLALCVYHYVALPKPVSDVAQKPADNFWDGYVATFVSYFKKDGIWLTLAFLLLFRFGEAQAVKLLAPFLKDSIANGGLGLDNKQFGLIYGTFGIASLTAGGILGGWLVSRFGLKKCLWPLVFAIHLPNLAFVYLAYVQPSSHLFITIAIMIEQFGYGLGFVSFMMYMILFSDGPQKTAHYSICTGFMALGMMLPGMASGWIQAQMGYKMFFVWVCIATIPAFVLTAFLKIPEGFGTKKSETVK